jgi:hypothetical protein
MFILFVLNDANEWEPMGDSFASEQAAEQFFHTELGSFEVWDQFEIQAIK